MGLTREPDMHTLHQSLEPVFQEMGRKVLGPEAGRIGAQNFPSAGIQVMVQQAFPLIGGKREGTKLAQADTGIVVCLDFLEPLRGLREGFFWKSLKELVFSPVDLFLYMVTKLVGDHIGEDGSDLGGIQAGFETEGEVLIQI